jgi:hypothetical protein
MGFPPSEVDYTSATTGRGDHEVHKGHVMALKEKRVSGHTADKNMSTSPEREYEIERQRIFMSATFNICIIQYAWIIDFRM